jgi:hypothetical protein
MAPEPQPMKEAPLRDVPTLSAILGAASLTAFGFVVSAIGLLTVTEDQLGALIAFGVGAIAAVVTAVSIATAFDRRRGALAQVGASAARLETLVEELRSTRYDERYEALRERLLHGSIVEGQWALRMATAAHANAEAVRLAQALAHLEAEASRG